MLYPNEVVDDSKHQDAILYLNDVVGREGATYDFVISYAKDKWAYEQKVFDDLEKKAEHIIQYLGGGTGLFTLGILAKIDEIHWVVAIAALVPICAALLAVYFAARAKKPDFVPDLPSVKDLKEKYIDAYPSEGEAIGAFIAQLNLACVDKKIACERKADWVVMASKTYFIAIVLLLIPFGTAVVLKATSPVPPPNSVSPRPIP